MKDIQLSLTIDETNAILQTLGQLPTSSGSYPLLMKIKSQADACVASGKAQSALASGTGDAA